MPFPSSPSINDTYSFNGKTWVWNGDAWALQRSGAINGLGHRLYKINISKE